MKISKLLRMLCSFIICCCMIGFIIISCKITTELSNFLSDQTEIGSDNWATIYEDDSITLIIIIIFLMCGVSIAEYLLYELIVWMWRGVYSVNAACVIMVPSAVGRALQWIFETSSLKQRRRSMRVR